MKPEDLTKILLRREMRHSTLVSIGVDRASTLKIDATARRRICNTINERKGGAS